MHVTRTALLIGGLAEKLATPNDTIRKHLMLVRVVQSTSVATTESHCASTTSLPCVLVEKPPDKHWFAPVTEDMELRTSIVQRLEYAMHTRCTSKDAVVRGAGCRRQVAPRIRVAIFDSQR
jgi:hypothetical protein